MSLRLIQRPGRKDYYISGTYLGVPVRKSTGVADRALAEQILAKVQKDIFDDHQAGPEGKKKLITFAEAVEVYLKTGGGNEQYLVPLNKELGNVEVGKINTLVVANVAHKLYPKGAPASHNRAVYTPVIAAITAAAENGLCGKPAITRPKKTEPRVRYLEAEEAERLIECCPPHLRPLVVFLFGTGARIGEALQLDWRHIDLARRQVNFIHNPAEGLFTKNGKSRGVPLHGRVIAELTGLAHRTGRVFLTHKGTPYSLYRSKKGNGQSRVRNAFTRACRKAGIENFSPHDCRHTWATWHYRANRDLLLLQQLGGWSSLSMVTIYAHLNVSNLAETIDASHAHWNVPAKPALRVVA